MNESRTIQIDVILDGGKYRSPALAFSEMSEKFTDKVMVGFGPDACWFWFGTVLDGYGRYGNRLVHRIAYSVAVGPIPEGMEIDHTCFRRDCCNPAHLRCVTHQENMRDVGARIAQSDFHRTLREQPFCLRGHPRSGENLVLKGKGKRRVCRACNALRSAAYKERRTLALAVVA